MRTILLVCMVTLSLGFAISLLSFLPQTRSEPYLRQTQQRVDKLQKDGTVSSWYTFYTQSFSCAPGDTISIRVQAQTSGESLSVIVSQTLGNTIEQRDDVENLDITANIPSSGLYTVTVNRYRYSPFVIWLAPAEAYIYVKTAITETRLVEDYRTVTTFPFKDLLLPGIVIMIAGIGVGVISIAQREPQTSRALGQTGTSDYARALSF